jgi:hypothetical protein
MIQIIDRFREFFSGNTGQVSRESKTMGFVKNRRAILRELLVSKESAYLIGVYCPAFGEGMFLTTVEAIEMETKNEIIVFSQYDVSGLILSRTRVSIDEIKMVCPFHVAYYNPLLDGYKSRKSNRDFELATSLV